MGTIRRVVAGLGVVVAVAFGTVISFAEVAGFVRGEVDVDRSHAWPAAVDVDLELGVEYSPNDWTFGLLLDVEEDGLEDLALLATGTLGALNLYSLHWLHPEFGGFLTFADWDNAAWIDVAGVELWGFLSVQTEDWFLGPLSGAGTALGGHGVAGDVELWGEVRFNLWEVLPFIYSNGLEYTIEKDLACDLIYVIDPTCSLDFSSAEVVVEFPFCCADVGTWIGFDDEGFIGAELWVQDIEIGDTGLVLETVDLWFFAEGKEVEFTLGLDLGEVLCVQPYVTLDQAAPMGVDGFEVAALELVCTIGDVTVTASELLSGGDYFIGIDGAIHGFDWFERWSVIPSDCVDPAFGVDEAIAIEVRRGGCCGDGSFVGLYSFFDLDLEGVAFDWLGLRARAESSISPTLSVFLESWIGNAGVESVAVGFDVAWGTLRSLPRDWTCCWLGWL